MAAGRERSPTPRHRISTPPHRQIGRRGGWECRPEAPR
ncbi:hypothetical protein KPATCC21470_4581 [Kitasatospora purpeofusca]